MPLTEKMLQDAVLKLIRSERLTDALLHSEDIEILAQDADENSFSAFSIDHLVRRATAEAASRALECLNMLEELTEDANVSVTASETLRPDIVCYNCEKETLVIFELKKSSQTGRQALTELLAYEHEIKNVLPFLSNYDTIFVLISTEWSTLLDHSVSSAVAWSGKTILCLDASLEKTKLKLTPRLPAAWRITGSRYFPPESLPSVTICLYGYTPENDEDDLEIDQRILTAIELIVREGDRIGGHGFLLLWKDHLPHSLTSYNISLCGVSPFAFYKAMRERGNIGLERGHLVRELDRVVKDFEPNGHAASMFAAAEAGWPLLKEISRPSFEGFHSWEVEQRIVRRRSTPLLCEFWGLPGVFAREFVSSPAVRKHKTQWLRNEDWRSPRIGINILNDLFEPEAFRDGNVRCSDCFKLGFILGRDLFLRQILPIATDEGRPLLHSLLRWGHYELTAILEEVRILANAANNVVAPEEPLAMTSDPSSTDISYADPIIDWLATEFLGSSPMHCRFFELGLNATLAFDPGTLEFAPDELIEEGHARLRPNFLHAYALILSFCQASKNDGGLSSGAAAQLRTLLKWLDLNTRMLPSTAIQRLNDKSTAALLAAWPALLDLADSIVPAVYHEHADVAPVNPDWAWLKQGIDEMRENNVAFPAVHLSANGSITTGPIGQSEVMVIGDVQNPELEVLFCDHSNGFMLVAKTTWEELKAGKYFPVKSGTPEDSPS